MVETDDEAPQGVAVEEEQEAPRLNLEVQVAEPSACQRHVTVTVPREDIERYYLEAFDELMPKAQVPGFRPGRAPRKLIESMYRKDVSEQVKGSLLLDTMTQVTEDREFAAIGEPRFDYEAVEIPDEGSLTFEFDLEVRPEFDLPKWKGLSVERPVREISEQDVDEHIQRVLDRYAAVQPHDGAAKLGDYVTVNVTFTHDGKPISELTDRTLRIRPVLSFRDGRLENFGKLMTRVKAGATKEATVTVSDDSPDENLRGQEVAAAIEVLQVQRREVPTLDEPFLKKIGGFSSEADLREFVKEELQRQQVYFQQQRVRQQITAQLTQTAKWDLPPDLLRRQSRRELERAVMELRSSGFSDDEIRAHENALRQNSLATTARALKEHFMLERIAEDENIEESEEDYDREIVLMAKQSGESPRRVRARLEKRGLMDALRNQVIERKVIDLIVSQAKVKDVSLLPKKEDVEAVEFSIGAEGETGSEIPEAKYGEAEQQLKRPADRS